MKNILIPVDWQSQDVHLADYAKAFEHIDNKKFSAFFLHDFLQHSERETAAAEADRLDFRFEMEKEARALDVDLQFLANTQNQIALQFQTRFADLLTIQVNENSWRERAHELPAGFLENMGCPVMITAQFTRSFNEIIVSFDPDYSALTALKSFLSLYGKMSREKSMTVITVISHDESNIVTEKCLIEFLQKYFSNVGTLPVHQRSLVPTLDSLVSMADAPLLLMGKSATHFLSNSDRMEGLIRRKGSLFYSV
jgi:hypothetical protein